MLLCLRTLSLILWALAVSVLEYRNIIATSAHTLYLVPPCSVVLSPVVSVHTVGRLGRVGVGELLLAVGCPVHGGVRVVRPGEDDGGRHIVQLVVSREAAETELIILL